MNLMQKLTEKFRESNRFIRFVVRNFVDDDCPYRASALAFTTLLAIVPLMAIAFTILSTFPAFQNLVTPIQNFIFNNFVPSTGTMIQNYLPLLATQASKLSVIGVVFVFIIALLVMYTIESAMNKIWRTGASRHGVSAFLLYWAIISLAPVLLGLSLVVSSYLLSMPFIANHDLPTLIGYLPFLFSLAGFTFLYVVVPNCQVRFLHGLYGGLIAALLFESAKIAFAYYLTRYNIYQLLYGAFATVPIFLVWIYWVWFITLLGAEVCYAFSVHHQRRPGAPLDGFSHALLWLYQLSLAQLEGKELTMDKLINAGQHAYAVDVDDMLKQFIDLNLVKMTSNGHFVLSRDLNLLTLYELTQLLPYRLPSLSERRDHEEMIAPGWQVPIQQADEQLRKTLMMSLGELFRSR